VNDVLDQMSRRFPGVASHMEVTRDGVATSFVPKERVLDVLRWAKAEAPHPFRMLYDLTAIDERARTHTPGPRRDFTVVYHLLSLEGNVDLRIKVPLPQESPSLPSVTRIFANANWYEREAWDMFGIVFDGHPNLRRILMPTTWKGHPLRKDHVARATEMGPFTLTEDEELAEEDALRFDPEAWGLAKER
jgi:NADH-quinone oxidoreductase subunit C/D